MADTPAVTMAERRLNDAHTAMAAATRDHARAIAYARRELAEALRAQEGPPASDWSTPPHIGQDDIETIRALSLQVGIPEHQFGTPLQEVELLRRLPDNLAALLIEHWRTRASDSWRCRELHHEGNIERLRDHVNQIVTAHECWTHSHPNEDPGRG